MFPAKELHESSGSFFGPYLLSEGSREPVWCRIGLSLVENSHGGVSKQDSGVPIDTVAVLNWCFLLRCCTNRVAASLDLTYYPRDRQNQFGVPYLLSGGSTEPSWCRIGASVVENSHGGVSK